MQTIKEKEEQTVVYRLESEKKDKLHVEELKELAELNQEKICALEETLKI